MSILIEITVFNEDTCEVATTLVQIYDGQYGYEVERLFEALGTKVAKIVDPRHDEV